MLDMTGNSPTTAEGNISSNSRYDSALIDSKLLEGFLQEVTPRPSGLTIHVDTEEKPVLIFDKKISNVRVDSAAATFAADSVTYRTKTIADRNKFCVWYQSPSPASFSKMKGQENVFGPPDVMFIKVIAVPHVPGK